MNCNIIIPTHNRPRYLQRILDYYSKYGNDFEIIVADSSSDENKKLNKKIILSFPNLKIQYLDKYSTVINPNYKFADVVNYADEEYCVFCADDDFITPNGIKRSIDFLERNPDFTVVRGNQISFIIKGKIFKWEPIRSCESIIFPDPKQRLIKHLSNYSTPTFHGVHRTNFLKMVREETIKFIDYDRFSELLPSMISLIYGKMKCLDVLYGVREEIFNSGGRTVKTFNDLIREGSYDEKYNNFRNYLAIHLSKEAKLSVGESEKIIDEAMASYLKKYCSNNNFRDFLIKKIKRILVFLNLPNSLYEKIRLIYLIIENSKPKDYYFLKHLEDPSSKYYNDFIKIRDCVISHVKN